MAIGKGKITIDWKNATAGMSTAADIADAGFSPQTDAVNLIAEPGVIYQPAQMADISTNVTGTMIASCEDPQILGATRVFVDDEGAYYSFNGTTLTKLRTDATSPTKYVQGVTDMIAAFGEVYATNKDYIVRWIVDTTFTSNFQAFTNSNVPHPALFFEGNAFYADKNLLLRQTAAAGTASAILTLAVDQTIVALGIDPQTGLMLVSTTTGLNISDTEERTNKVGYYDGYSNKFRNLVTVDEMVTAFHPVGPTVYVGYGMNLGYWAGSGIEFLRALSVARDNTRLPYKHKFSHIANTLYVVEGNKLLAFGEVKRGSKVFYYALSNQSVTTRFSMVANIGSGKLGVSFTTDKFYSFDTMSVATGGTQTLYTNKYEFDDPIFLRRAKIFWKNGVSTNVDPGSFFILDEGGSAGAAIDIKNTDATTVYKKEVNLLDTKTSTAQFRVNLDTTNPGIRKIIIYYDPAE